jgi:hypothetical protein
MYIVEKQIGYLKRFKSLDNIRNTVVGHIQIDYRIACSFYNFTFEKKPVCPDGLKAKQITAKIREKATCQQINKLELILNKQLNTKIFPEASMEELNDFVKLKRKQLRDSLFFGSYQLRQSKSYLRDIHNCPVYILNKREIMETDLKEKLIKDFFKIIAFKIVSRHVRGKTKRGFRRIYKVFIEYEPYVSNSSGIKGKIFLHVIILFF